ncbi:MAG: efflux RND transporter periplasmic adaptor subunit [Rhodospirillaceae bacterium]|nr:efflux RND transporter periplasmic adaptor subunit [Rhodospirillaceae bacterium]
MAAREVQLAKSLTWGALALFALVVAALLYQSRSDETALPASGDVKTARVVRESLSREVIATGVIRPVVGAEINVGSRVSGIVRSLPVKIGDVVEAGDLLVELDPTPFEAVVAQAAAELELAKAERALAESNLKRKQGLAAQGHSSAADLEAAIRDLAVAQAQIGLKEARLQSARIELGYSRITAPIRGVIADVTTRKGETVAASFAAPKFVSIVDLDQLEVQAFVDETDIGRIYIGQKGRFEVDTYSDATFEATVTAINPKAAMQGSVINYVVVLTFAGQEGRVLRPEMTAHVRLTLDERQGVLTAPRNALRQDNGRQFVIVERAGDWIQQPVRIGWRTDQKIEIVDGVAEGDVLQLNPN